MTVLGILGIALIVLIIGAGLYAYLGFYDVAASNPHTDAVRCHWKKSKTTQSVGGKLYPNPTARPPFKSENHRGIRPAIAIPRARLMATVTATLTR